MISAFVSNEFGHGMQLNKNDQLTRINTARDMKSYSDEFAVISKFGNNNNVTTKPKLTKSPIVQELEYCASSIDRYWSYDAMAIIQFENSIDCFKTLYPEFDYVFIFDHLKGHDHVI